MNEFHNIAPNFGISMNENFKSRFLGTYQNPFERSFLLRTVTSNKHLRKADEAEMPGDLLMVEQYGGLFWHPGVTAAELQAMDSIDRICSWPADLQSWFLNKINKKQWRTAKGWESDVRGLNDWQITALLMAYNRAEIELNDEKVGFAEIKISKTTVHHCELTEMLIPTGTPYLQKAGQWECLSLHSFYQYLGVRLRSPDSEFYTRMAQHLHLNKDVLDRVLWLSHQKTGTPVVKTKTPNPVMQELSL